MLVLQQGKLLVLLFVNLKSQLSLAEEVLSFVGFLPRIRTLWNQGVDISVVDDPVVSEPVANCLFSASFRNSVNKLFFA